jgi:hypothetical protein
VSDRRFSFFLAAAAICAGLVPLAPAEFRWVPAATAVAYVVLAILVALDSISRQRRHAASEQHGP